MASERWERGRESKNKEITRDRERMRKKERTRERDRE